MPANPENVGRREVLSEDYHEDKVTIDCYTNNAIAIYRGDEDKLGSSKRRVWLDSNEKRALYEVLKEELEEC